MTNHPNRKPKKVDYIDVECDIWQTRYTIKDYGHKIVVKAPFTRWCGSSGSLDFETITITDAPRMQSIRTFVERKSLLEQANNQIGYLSIVDVLEGHQAAGVNLI